MYLSKDSLEVEIISSKSSEMNVMIPKGDGDFVSIIFQLNIENYWLMYLLSHPDGTTNSRAIQNDYQK
jgi:hypothetical protein